MLDEANTIPYQPDPNLPNDGNPNQADSYAGSQALYQDFTIPANATSVQLSMVLYINSLVPTGTAPWTDPNATPDLDYRDINPNQQVRVDITSITGNILDVTSSVLLNVFQTTPTTPGEETVDISGVDLSQFAGKTVRLRIATTNNQGQLIVGVDNVDVQTTFADSSAPQFLSLGLRNPTYLAGPNAAGAIDRPDDHRSGRGRRWRQQYQVDRVRSWGTTGSEPAKRSSPPSTPRETSRSPRRPCCPASRRSQCG